MRFDSRSGGVGDAHQDLDPVADAPGRRTLAEQLAAPPAITGSLQARSATTSAPAVEDRSSLSGVHRPTLASMFGGHLRRDAGGPPSDASPEAAAARGIATPSTPLPFLSLIQRSFGRHDVASVQAHVGDTATASARALNADAYATGNHVVLGPSADLFTVAHEAAHVVQQRGGIQLKGLGQAGDVHEQHADEVAVLVVRGESAEAVLDRGAGGSGSTTTAIQRMERGTVVTTTNWLPSDSESESDEGQDTDRGRRDDEREDKDRKHKKRRHSKSGGSEKKRSKHGGRKDKERKKKRKGKRDPTYD